MHGLLISCDNKVTFVEINEILEEWRSSSIPLSALSYDKNYALRLYFNQESKEKLNRIGRVLYSFLKHVSYVFESSPALRGDVFLYNEREIYKEDFWMRVQKEVIYKRKRTPPEEYLQFVEDIVRQYREDFEAFDGYGLVVQEERVYYT